MLAVALAVAVALDVPAERRNPPLRSSSVYGSFLEACGCEGVEPVPRAASDYDRFMRTCGHARERMPKVKGVAPSPASSPAKK